MIDDIVFFILRKNVFIFYFVGYLKSVFLKKNNIFAFVNIDIVSGYSDFYEFCILF